MKQYPIVICGGHISPAIAVIERLLEKKKYSIFYLGRKNSIEKDSAKSLEYTTIRQLKIPFYSIITGKLHRHLPWLSFFSLIKIPIGFFQGLYYLSKIKPKIVISFGGYLALPICISAWLLRIPIIIHEQTRVLGLSNRIISRFAQVLCLTWEKTRNIPSRTNIVVTGLPIRKSIISKKNTGFFNFGNNKLPLLLIIGGSVGSRSINKIIAEILPQLVVKFRVVHQCGSINKSEDFKKLLNLKNSLPKSTKKNYLLTRHINPDKIGYFLKQSDLIISRAGANTVAEIAILKKKVIFIPLPWAADEEQKINTEFLEKMGYAVVLDQRTLDKKTLLRIIVKTYQQKINPLNIDSNEKVFPYKNGTNSFSEIVESIIEHKFPV